MYKEWSPDFELIQRQIADAGRLLRVFGTGRSLTLARHVVLNITCDYACTPTSTEQAHGTEHERAGSTTVQGVTPDIFNPPSSSAIPRDMQDVLVRIGRSASGNNSGSAAQLKTASEVQWAMHAITYGLTLPIEHWDVVQHSVHICCFWLRCLLSGAGSTSRLSACPTVLRRDPNHYISSILFTLTYAFLPRYPDPLCDRIRWLISSLGQTANVPPFVHRTTEEFTEPIDPQNTSDRNSPLLCQLEVTQMVVQCINTVLSQPSDLAPPVWDSLLQFCLVICHYVLAFPLPIPDQRILHLSPIYSTSAVNVPTGSNAGTVNVGGSASGSGIGGSSSVLSTGTRSAPSDSTGESLSVANAESAEKIAESVFGLLMNVWMKACTYCFPRPQMWAALKECVKVWRHQPAVACIWSNVLVTLTDRMLSVLQKTSTSKTDATSTSSVDKTETTMCPREMSAGAVKETWFRLLHIMGNPVDLCDPHVLATPVLEECRKTPATVHVGRASVYLPYIYHHMIRGLATVVDGFLGIQPSLTVGFQAALGVGNPSAINSAEADGSEVKKSSLANIAAYQSSRSSSTYEKSSSRKTRLAGMVTSAGHLASSGSVGLRNYVPVASAVSVDAALMPLGNIAPSLSSLAPSLNQPSATFSFLPSGHIGITKPSQIPAVPADVPVALLQSSSSQPQSTGAKPSVTSSGSLSSSSATMSEPQHEQLNTFANRWLGPERSQTVCALCPEANSLLHLFGSWLFEASVAGAEKDLNSDAFAVITTRCDQFASGLSFQVGRAEALSTLCRIVIYAGRHNLAREYLIRFYLCLFYGLETETGRNPFTLSSVLFSAIDLLRVDLPGINILLPRLFAACQYVFREENVIRPEYLSMTMLRRAAIHQLMSMVCIPIQFKTVILRCLVPVSTTVPDPMAMSDLKTQLAYFLCDGLSREKDAVNLKMLLSTSLALLEDMAADEAQSAILSPRSRPEDSRRTDPKCMHTAVGFCKTLVLRLRNLLSKESVVQFVLDILGGIAFVRLSPPDLIMYRDTVHAICEFITRQLKRDSKDHKRQLHSIIVAAYSCLSQWLVEHSHLILTDRECLAVVLGTIEFGICGAKYQLTREELAEAQRNSKVEFRLVPPEPRARKSMNPSSKRVREAAEACLAALVSLAGQFPGASGPETTCSRLIEDHLLRLIAPNEVGASEDLLQALHKQFRYFWSEPGVILGVLETSQCRDILLSRGFVSENHPDLPQTLLVVRGAFGRHIWAVQMRLLPKQGSDAEYTAAPTNSSGPPRPRPWGCFLERLINTINRNETIQPLNFPPSIGEIPLVDADRSIKPLDQVGGAPGTRSREEINTLKSLITSQSIRMKEVGSRSLKSRLATPCPDPLVEASPPSVRTSFQAARLLLTHLGYLTVNSFSMLGPDASDIRLAQSASGAGASGTDARRNSQLPSNDQPTSVGQTGPTFYPLDPTHSEFSQLLDSLDCLPTRTADTLLVFYVAAGQTKPEEILGNMRSWSQLPAEFHAFLRGLGAYVDIVSHPGWTGRLETSYRPNPARIAPQSASQQSPSRVIPDPDTAPDGTRYIIYAADAITELACLCPTDFSFKVSSEDVSNTIPKIMGPRPPVTSYGRHGSLVVPSGTSGESGADPTGGRVAVVWLQRWEDGPLNSGADCPGWSTHNLTSQTFGCQVTIYISELSSKLYRIGVIRALGRVFDAGPLINGMVLSQRCLSSFVRQTVCNISRSRRLASDQFQPPHVKRQYRVLKLGQTCRLRTEPEPTETARSMAPVAVKPGTLLGLFNAAG